jgi:hypothetical protein
MAEDFDFPRTLISMVEPFFLNHGETANMSAQELFAVHVRTIGLLTVLLATYEIFRHAWNILSLPAAQFTWNWSMWADPVFLALCGLLLIIRPEWLVRLSYGKMNA